MSSNCEKCKAFTNKFFNLRETIEDLNINKLNYEKELQLLLNTNKILTEKNSEKDYEIKVLKDELDKIKNNILINSDELELYKKSNKAMASDMEIKERFIVSLKSQTLSAENDKLQTELNNLKMNLECLKSLSECKICPKLKDRVKSIKIALKELQLLSDSKEEKIKSLTNEVSDIKIYNNNKLRIETVGCGVNEKDQLIKQLCALKAICLSQADQLRQTVTKTCTVCKDTADLIFKCFNNNIDWVLRTSASKNLLADYKRVKVTLLSHIQTIIGDEIVGDNKQSDVTNEADNKSKSKPVKRTTRSSEVDRPKISYRERSPSYGSSNKSCTSNEEEERCSTVSGAICEPVVGLSPKSSAEWKLTDIYDNGNDEMKTKNVDIKVNSSTIVAERNKRNKENVDYRGNIVKDTPSRSNMNSLSMTSDKSSAVVLSDISGENSVASQHCKDKKTRTSRKSAPQTKRKYKRGVKKPVVEVGSDDDDIVLVLEKTKKRMEKAPNNDGKLEISKENTAVPICDEFEVICLPNLDKEVEKVISVPTKVGTALMVEDIQRDHVDTEMVACQDAHVPDCVTEESKKQEELEQSMEMDELSVTPIDPNVPKNATYSTKMNSLSMSSDKSGLDFVTSSKDKKKRLINKNTPRIKKKLLPLNIKRGAKKSVIEVGIDDDIVVVLEKETEKRVHEERHENDKEDIVVSSCVQVNSGIDVSQDAPMDELEGRNSDAMIRGEEEKVTSVTTIFGSGEGVTSVYQYAHMCGGVPEGPKMSQELEHVMEVDELSETQNSPTTVGETMAPIEVVIIDSDSDSDDMCSSRLQIRDLDTVTTSTEQLRQSARPFNEHHVLAQDQMSDSDCGPLDLSLSRPQSGFPEMTLFVKTETVEVPCTDKVQEKSPLVVSANVSVPVRDSSPALIIICHDQVLKETAPEASSAELVNITGIKTAQSGFEEIRKCPVSTKVQEKQGKSNLDNGPFKGGKVLKVAKPALFEAGLEKRMAKENTSATDERKAIDKEKMDEIRKRTNDAKEIIKRKSEGYKGPVTVQVVTQETSNICKMIAQKAGKSVRRPISVLDKIKRKVKESERQMYCGLRPINDKTLVIMERSTKQELDHLKVSNTSTDYMSGNKRSRMDSAEEEADKRVAKRPKIAQPIERKQSIGKEKESSTLTNVRIAQILTRKLKDDELERFQRMSLFVNGNEMTEELKETVDEYKNKVASILAENVVAAPQGLQVLIASEIRAIRSWDLVRLVDALLDLVAANRGPSSLPRGYLVQASACVIVNVLLLEREHYTLYYEKLLHRMQNSDTVTLLNLLSINVTVLSWLKQTDVIVSFLVDLLSMPMVPVLLVVKCLPVLIVDKMTAKYASFVALLKLLVVYELSTTKNVDSRSIFSSLSIEIHKFWLDGRTCDDFEHCSDLALVVETVRRTQKEYASVDTKANWSYLDHIVENKYR